MSVLIAKNIWFAYKPCLSLLQSKHSHTKTTRHFLDKMMQDVAGMGALSALPVYGTSCG